VNAAARARHVRPGRGGRLLRGLAALALVPALVAIWHTARLPGLLSSFPPVLAPGATDTRVLVAGPLHPVHRGPIAAARLVSPEQSAGSGRPSPRPDNGGDAGRRPRHRRARHLVCARPIRVDAAAASGASTSTCAAVRGAPAHTAGRRDAALTPARDAPAARSAGSPAVERAASERAGPERAGSERAGSERAAAASASVNATSRVLGLRSIE